MFSLPSILSSYFPSLLQPCYFSCYLSFVSPFLKIILLSLECPWSVRKQRRGEEQGSQRADYSAISACPEAVTRIIVCIARTVLRTSVSQYRARRFISIVNALFTFRMEHNSPSRQLCVVAHVDMAECLYQLNWCS